MSNDNFKASGVYTKQAHVRIPDGLYEEEHGREGFFGKVSQIYHSNPLTSWTNIEGDLRPRNLPPVFDEKELKEEFVPYLYNDDLIISLGSFTKDFANFQRNADFDEMYFAHAGEGRH